MKTPEEYADDALTGWPSYTDAIDKLSDAEFRRLRESIAKAVANARRETIEDAARALMAEREKYIGDEVRGWLAFSADLVLAL
jgi:signal recognition particle subunit SEC65